MHVCVYMHVCVFVCLCVCVHVCLCLVYIRTYPKIHMHCRVAVIILAKLLLESIVEQGVVDLLCSSLSAHERHQGVQAVALRTLVLLSEDGKTVCVYDNNY